jgi:membrane protease YdiL (CAAX protease family)
VTWVHVDVSRRERAAAVAVFVASAGLLWMRLGVVGRPDAGPVLLAVYGLVWASAVAAPVPSSTTPRTGAVAPALVLFTGVAAVALAGALTRPSIAVPVTMSGLGLNTLAAVAEEALFRRLAYGWLERYGAVVAVVATALAFGAVHVPVYGLAALPVDVGAGVLLSWQRAASGTWTVPAATHVAANIVAVVA